MTLDGKIATRTGQSQWLTGEFSRQYVHYLRSGYDAILTTAETVRADNPQLTVREIPNARQPVRIIIDRRFRLNPDNYRIFKTKNVAPTWIVTSKISHDTEHAKQARALGVEVIEVDETGLGINLKDMMDKLGEKGITSIFVVGGGKLTGQLMNQSLVNKMYLFYGSKLLPDPTARTAFFDSLNLNLAGAPNFNLGYVRRLENDMVMEVYPIIKRDLVKEAVREAKKEALKTITAV
jgi:diaminohydroxyphosphoribosylaminopyrimidine deaminase/5-amino-6-(5-phosphoribosylamino)uracil reductase